ncbi:hypothetical protein CJF60_00180 [Mycoplasmopsis agassizii]|uniref:DUF4209 domain-containing protein n=1 Tax=Mycoplasmopsis agassizii TaxID=33922 RepID=A0ABX4H5D5_9BACT|nr:hypothetical protein CJF60_00180 [Mycoplasmopsis agassizii]
MGKNNKLSDHINHIFEEVIGIETIKILRYELVNDPDKEITNNFRNRLMHGRNIEFSSLDSLLLLHIFYLFMMVINSFVAYNSNIEGKKIKKF